ncbi:IS66 family insertion sequence element accessory protein TnpB [Lysinibacillus contaminans]
MQRTSFGKYIDGLATIIKEEFELNPFSFGLFVFCNRFRGAIKQNIK